MTPEANAVSVGISHVPAGKPHGVSALAGIIEGIIEGAKESIAAINIVLTILRKLIVAPSDIPGA